MVERGVIYNRERARQIIDFSGLQYGKITPTDIDGFIDFGNKLFIYLEYKLIGAEFKIGQRVAIERIVRSSRVPCYALLCRHDVEDIEKDINAANAVVDIYYTQKGVWRKPKMFIIVKDEVDILHEKYELPL